MKKSLANQKEFLLQLGEQLIGLNEESKKEILYDYEEHFNVGLSKGQSEEEIINRLGDPKLIASQYKFEKAIKQAEHKLTVSNVLKAILAGISLSLFNLIFVLGFYVAVVASIFALTISFVATAVAGLAGMVQAVLPFELSWFHNPIGIETLGDRAITFFIGLGVVILSSLLIFLFIKLGKTVYKFTIKYLKANLEIIKKASIN